MIQLFDETAVEFAEIERQKMIAESERFWASRPKGKGKQEEYLEEAKSA